MQPRRAAGRHRAARRQVPCGGGSLRRPARDRRTGVRLVDAAVSSGQWTWRASAAKGMQFAAAEAAMILLDTHAVIWLMQGHRRARPLQELPRLYVSPATGLEVQSLAEVGRYASPTAVPRRRWRPANAGGWTIHRRAAGSPPRAMSVGRATRSIDYSPRTPGCAAGNWPRRTPCSSGRCRRRTCWPSEGARGRGGAAVHVHKGDRDGG